MRDLVAGLAFVMFSAVTGHADTAEPPPIAAPAAWVPKDGSVIAFDVFRKGNPFGTHILTFQRLADDEFTVTSDVDLKAGLGPITVFRYSLDATERWKDGQLVGLSGATNDDGNQLEVEAEATPDGLSVDGSAFKGDVRADIIPSSHWNIAQMYSDTMLSTESGEILEIQVEQVGDELIDVNGTAVPATRYLLDSDIDVDLWYDDNGRWVKLAFEVRGQDIEYRLRSLYD